MPTHDQAAAAGAFVEQRPDGASLDSSRRAMKGRFYYADGRVAEEVNLDDRAVRYALAEDQKLRWFRRTDDVDPDGFTVLREIQATSAGSGR